MTALGLIQYSQPRSIVLINGNPVPFFTWTVTMNGYGAADTFSVDIPFRILQKLQGTTDLANTPDIESDLLVNPDILVEIYVGYPSNPSVYSTTDLTQIMYGYMDTLDLYFQGDNSNGYYATLQGRNQVAPFLDTETTNKYPNLTSSAIVSYFAQQNKLSTNITPTYTLVSKYYANDNTHLTANQSQWDLILYLAQQEGFLASVVGNAIYFGPQSSFLSTNSILYTWNKNLKSLTISRSPHAARNIKVYVYSWIPGSKTRIESVASATTGYAPRIHNTNQRQDYVETYYYPGLTKDQCDRMAKSILQRLSATEITGTFTTQGNPSINPYQSIQIAGIGAGIDGVTFWPTQATHTFDTSSGSYSLDVQFSNLLLSTNPGGV